MNSKPASDGWKLISAEERHAESPATFEIPSREKRLALAPGDAAKLLFEIECREDGRLIEHEVHRMWVIVKTRVNGGYLGVLDNDHGMGEGVSPKLGDVISFGPEHIASIDSPPSD